MPKQKKEEALALVQNVDYQELKKELTFYIDQELRNKFVNEIDKANRKVIKEKNRKILARDVVIILLVLFTGYLVYILYHNNYFDRFLSRNYKDNKQVVDNNQGTNTKEETKPTLEDNIKKYGYLIDNIYINENSKYLKDFYNGNISSEIENYLALNQINFESLTTEEDYNIIDDDILKELYEQLYTSSHTYKSKSFKYNNQDVRFISKLKSYVSDEILTRDTTSIKREIINIEIADNTVKITTIEGLVKDNKVYNILTNTEVGESKDSLKEYEAKLNKLTYTFKDNKLDSIQK